MMEYWAHEACFIRPDHFHDLVQWQNRKWVGAHAMDPNCATAWRPGCWKPGGRQTDDRRRTDRPAWPRRRPAADNWGWNWNAVKRVLEHLFEEGLVSASSRTESFERRYTLTAKGAAAATGQERRLPNRTPLPRWTG